MRSTIVALLFASSCLAGTVATHEQDRPVSRYEAPPIVSNTVGLRQTVQLRAYASSGKVGLVQVVLRQARNDWAFFRSAWSSGRELPFKTLDSSVVDGGTIEDVAAAITLEELERAAKDGLQVTFKGTRADATVKLKPAYVREFLGKFARQTKPDGGT